MTTLTPLTRAAACCFVTLLWLLRPSPVQAQEEFVEPAAKYITTIPFNILTGGVIIVKARLDEFGDTLNFVFDTGSGGISLDSVTCRELNLKTVVSDKIVRGIAGVKNVEFTYGHTLHLPGLDVKNLDFHINDYELLTSAYGIRIDGIMGYSFLRRYIAMVDYDTLSMRIFTPGRLKYPRGGYVLKPQFSTLPMQQVNIRDNTTVNGKFYFDTGAGLCMLLNDDMVQDSSLFKRKRKLYPTQAEGLGGKKQVYISTVTEVKLGPYRFRNTPVYVFHDEFNVTMYPTLGGLIGNDILRRFNVILNYPAQEIFIKPNRHYTDSFDYSYTGMSVYLIDGAITIQDIVKKSPADEAGLKDGDIIIGIENNVSNNIQTYKALLQNAGAKVRMLILRNGQPKIIYLRIKSIW